MSEKKAEKTVEAAMPQVGLTDGPLPEQPPDDAPREEGQDVGAKVNPVPKDAAARAEEELEEIRNLDLGGSDRARAPRAVNPLGKK